MKKSTLTSLVTFGLAYVLLSSSASAFSLSFGAEDQSPFFEKFVSSLFQNSNKIGAALIGEVTSIDISTSSNVFTLSSKQKLYSIGISSETKVRKLGIPAELADIKAGDKVSVVSSVSKTETPKLRAKVISILSQAGESKYKVASTTEALATSTEATTTAALPPAEKEKDDAPQKESKEVKEKESVEFKEKGVKEMPTFKVR